MPKTSTEKTLDFQERYRKFIFLILQYQENFENFIAPIIAKDNLENVDKFLSMFSPMHNETMIWIEKNKSKILAKYNKQTGEQINE